MPRAKPKKTNGGPRTVKVFTLRLGPSTEKKLHQLVLKRSREEGRTVSYNRTMVDLIEDAARR